MTRSVDPFYYSFGTPYLRRDNFRIETKAEQPFLKNQIAASISYRRDEDNIYSLKEGTSINNSFIYTLNVKFKKYPFLIVTYSPNYQSFYNAISKSKYSSTVKLYNITAGYTKQGRNIIATTVLNYTKQYNQTTTEGFSLFHIDQYAVNENLYIKPIDLNTTAGITYVLPYQTGDTGRVFIATLSASKSVFKKKVNLNGSYAYQKDFGYQQRNIIQAGTNFSLGWKININIRVEHHFIQSTKLQTTDMNLGRITITKAF
jgi:hypothetical protein